MEKAHPDGRWRRLKDLAVSAILRAAKRDFRSQKRMVAIIGDHIGDQIRARGLYERDHLEFLRDDVLDLEACRGKVALDVGANIGNHSLFFSDLFHKVIAFEPNPIACSILDINLQLNGVSNVDVRPFGLSDRASTAQLLVPAHNLGGAKLIETPRSPSDRVQTVNLVRGDDVLDDELPIGLIKIDVEGAEAAVLLGLSETIRRNRPVIVLEQLREGIDSSGSSPVFSMLRHLDYDGWEIRSGIGSSRFGRGIAAVVRGANPLRILAIKSLEPRDYPMLLFRPADDLTYL